VIVIVRRMAPRISLQTIDFEDKLNGFLTYVSNDVVMLLRDSNMRESETPVSRF
jgi:hypothetical protein